MLRVADWGGGYPRPFVEAIEEKWRAEEGEGFRISADPYLEKKLLEKEDKDKEEEEMRSNIISKLEKE